ncbi:TonB-dependent receptor [Thermosinus carboxydivorans Nor1]|uniref:TonB-dependent receptor n=1 Tax=Thermosinus carboxydivorans Nor1 TaxID=401526 RepID=A1HNQ0_9FIRM|nr:TonB-dependent receptor [Thermosinus carboxydivorans]EAX48403.1 TonB-dependent receptor [Thermosinus carboxydivorans Nor1]
MYPKFVSGKLLTAAVALMFLVCLPFSIVRANEAENSPEFSLETIYVTGKSIQGENEPQKKLSINVKDKIDAGQINSVTDLLRDVAGFTVQFSPQSGTQVTMRGVSGERFLVAINGNILENQGGLMRGRGLEWDMIPITNVQKIEIMRGASSAIYGGTWGGLVNIVTIQEPGETKTETKFSYGSYDTRKFAITTQGSTNDGKFFWTINGNKDTSDGFYRNNWNDIRDLNLNISYKLQDSDKLTFAWTTIERKEGSIVGNNPTSTNGYDPNYPTVPDAPTFGLPGIAPKPWIDGSYRYWKGNNYSLNYTTDTTKLSLYQNDQFRQEWVRTILIPTLTKSWESDLVNRGVNWQQTLSQKDHKITYGLQYQTINYDLISSQSALNTDQTGVFLQDDWKWKKDVIVGVGLRYDQHKLDMQVFNSSLAQKPRKDTDSRLSPKVSITRQLNDNEAIFASASSVFRPPTASDYYRWSGNYFDWSVGSNPRLASAALGFASQAEWQKAVGVLGPEHGMSYELGWKKADGKLGWRVTGFYNDIDNYITTFMPSYIKGYPPTYNIGNAKIKGFETSADYTFDKRLTSVLAFTHQTGSKSGDPLDPSSTLNNIPRNTVNFGLRYQVNKEFRTALDTRYTGRRSVSGATLGGYVTTDVSFLLNHKDAAYTFAICNIFNKQYQEYVGYPMPGTTYHFSWQTKF